MGKKYILEIEENKDGDFAWSNFAPYIEPNFEQVRQKAYEKAYADAVYNCSEGCSHVEQVRKESYQKGYDDAVEKIGLDEQAIADKAYKKGLSDAWEAARKIGSNSMCSLKEMGFDFSRCVVADYNPSWFVVKNYSASEAIEKIRQYEQTQKELEQEKEEKPIRAEDVMRQYLTEFCKKHSCRDRDCALHTPDFTCGRGYHFLTDSPVSDEEVRRAYAKVVKCKSCEVQKL